MIFTIYAGANKTPSPSLSLILQFFTLMGDTFIVHNDVKQMMLLSMGKVNPNSGFVVLIQGKQCFDIFDVTHHYKLAGLILC